MAQNIQSDNQFVHGSGVPPRKLVPLWAVAATADSVQDGSPRMRPNEEEGGGGILYAPLCLSEVSPTFCSKP